MKHKNKKKKVVEHLKKDIETFKHEAHEDRELIKELKNKKKSPKRKQNEKTINERTLQRTCW